MSSMSMPWRLFRRVVQQRDDRPMPDPADMGTAFGLDYSLSQTDVAEPAAGDDAFDPFRHPGLRAPAARR